MANDLIRMSGMNSGLDTESIINALTANSKLKVTKQERNVKKYEATQEAYRDIISKMQSIKSKYFDLLNKDSYLSGTSMWNKYAAKTYDNTGKESNIKGLTVATTLNSQAGDYDFEIKSNATQTKITGSSIGGNATIDLDSITNQTNDDGSFKELGITVTVGGVEKNITFNSAATQQDTINNLNAKLEEAFGQSNDSSPNIDGTDKWTGNDYHKNFEGMVYVKGTGKIESRDSKGVTISGVSSMSEQNKLDYSHVKTGTNNLTLQVGDQTLNVSFQSISSDYFTSAVNAGIINTQTGETIDPDAVDNEGNNIWDNKAKLAAFNKLGSDASDLEIEAYAEELKSEWSGTVPIYEATVSDYKESVRYKAYKDYVGDDDSDGSHKDFLYEKAEADHRSDWIGKKISNNSDLADIKTQYDEYASNVAEGETAKSLYDWTLEQRSTTWVGDDNYAAARDAFDAIVDTYEGTEEIQNGYAADVLSDTTKQAYEASGSSDGLYKWATENASSELASATQTLDEWKTANPDKVNAANLHLSKSTFLAGNSGDYRPFDYYKKYANPDDTGLTFDCSAANVVNHFNDSALKNSIGNLSSNGVSFSASLDASTGLVDISAYTTADDGTKTNVPVAVTVGRGSANKASDFGLAESSNATTQISQVTNTTKLSEIMNTDGGSFSFTINGKDFSFDGDTTVSDMMKKVNASAAGVKMSFSSLNNQFTLTSSEYGVDGKIDFTDTDGLLGSIGLSKDNIERGTNLSVLINGELYETSGNTVEVDGTTFTITGKHDVGEKFSVNIAQDTSAIADVIKGFVEDYNKLIEDVYKYLDEKPEKDYYFLADADKEDLDLSEKQEEKWEEKSKKGLLYHDSTTQSIMSNLRMALMGSVEGLDGNTFSLLDLGIKTSSNYNEHGKLSKIDEDALNDAIITHGDDIMKLFTDSENGIMKKFSAALDGGIGTTGDNKGTLIKKAGLASGSSSTDNEIYNAIKRTKTKITSLTKRYENEQDRLWKRYSNMESLLGTMNSQQASFSSYFMQ